MSYKYEYLMWAASRWMSADKSCPACSSSETRLIKRKYIVTALFRCEQCRLMFRVPKGDAEDSRAFYQAKYSQGFTTECPSDHELHHLKESQFKGTEKDYATYISVLKAADLQSGQSVLDFGCSWGYGSWQLARAGFLVYSYEIGLDRARYASEKLGCQMLSESELTSHKVDCFFSAHVIEHLTNPRTLWETASRALNSNGMVIIFMPNGELSRAEKNVNYHKLWGKVHPLLLTSDALKIMAGQYGFVGQSYSTPYDLIKIAKNEPGQLEGEELLFIARRS